MSFYKDFGPSFFNNQAIRIQLLKNGSFRRSDGLNFEIIVWNINKIHWNVHKFVHMFS